MMALYFKIAHVRALAESKEASHHRIPQSPSKEEVKSQASPNKTIRLTSSSGSKKQKATIKIA
jgi:hypothetical protein